MAAWLLALATFLAVPAPAAAQDELWSATLTVGATTTDMTLFGYHASMDGFDGDALTPVDVNLPDNSAPSVIVLTNDNDDSSGTLTLGLHGTVTWLNNADNRGMLTLNVGTNTFAFANGAWEATDGIMTWTNSGLTWANGESLQVSITSDSTEDDGDEPGEEDDEDDPPTDDVYPPTPPRNLQATGEDRAVSLAWRAPVDDGGSRIVRYEYRQKEGDGPFGRWQIIWDRRGEESHVVTRRHRITGLTNRTRYTFELRAVNNGGWASPPSDSASATPEKRTPVPAAPAAGLLVLAALLAAGRTVIGRFRRLV